MKNLKKVLIIVMSVVLLVTASVMGTMAYLTSNAEVKNTFTAGDVEITLLETKVDEYGVPLTGDDAGTTTTNEYKLVPGREYTKDPTITVSGTSEDCWLFAVIDNQLGDAAALNILEGWDNFTGTNVWYYESVVSASAEKTIFDKFTYGADIEDPSADADKEIVVTAYAIQAATLETAEDAAKALNLIS